LLAELYTLAAKKVTLRQRRSYLQRAAYHTGTAANLKSAILDIFWEPLTLAFYDFNVTSDKRNTWFSPAAFYPFWNGIIPNELFEEEKAKAAFAAVRMVMARYNGTFPGSFVETGLQWDAPK
jgi:alpha,alpha-trehalase